MSESACACDSHQDPQVVKNLPGEPVITDRVDEFTGFRRALLHPLPGEAALGNWHPTPGDLGLQFLEWWAYLADVLTFYNERIANETYLRTAQFPESVAGLVALLGYVPAPGLAATGHVGAIRTTTHPAEPLVIPGGMQLSSTGTPGVPPQTFEAEPGSFAGPSDILVTLAPNPTMHVWTDASGADIGPASVLLAGKVTSARPGDQLLLVNRSWAGRDSNWSAVTVAAVDQEIDPGTGAVNTRVSFTSAARWEATAPLTPIDTSPDTGTFPTSVATPARTVAVRPALLSIVDRGWSQNRIASKPQPQPRRATDYRLVKPIAAASLWSSSGTGVVPGQPAVANTYGAGVNLSSAVPSIQPGELVLFDGGNPAGATLGLVARTAENLGVIPFPQTLDPPAADLVVPYTTLDVRVGDKSRLTNITPTAAGLVTVRHSFRDVGTVLADPAIALPGLPVTVAPPAAFTLPAAHCMALLEDATGAGALVEVSQVENNGTLLLRLDPTRAGLATFAPPLQPPLRLILDVMPVSRGTTVTGEVLGSGNAAVANQRFPLAKSPLTYFASGAEWTAALSVHVDGVEWKKVPTLYGQQPNAQVYVVEESPDQHATIRFGDGLTGSRLPSGAGNVKATYRYGSGAASPPAGRLTTMVQRQPNLAAIHNPVAVSGGADPPLPAHVKTDAPASVFTFGRAISALDYETIATQTPGVTRAKAYWTFDAASQRSLVKIYVNNDAGGVLAATQALAGSDDPNRPVIVAAAKSVDVYVSATLVVAANRVVDDVLAAATAAFVDSATGAFSPTQMQIGQWLYRSRVSAALIVPGVIAVHHLEVRWVVAPRLPGGLSLAVRLDQVADPGEGAYFQLSPDSVALTAVIADD